MTRCVEPVGDGLHDEGGLGARRPREVTYVPDDLARRLAARPLGPPRRVGELECFANQREVEVSGRGLHLHERREAEEAPSQSEGWAQPPPQKQVVSRGSSE